MGKGFNNYMCKKFFHPASLDNLKRVWMAQQKTDAYKKKQEELNAQYQKEQDLYNNRAMLAKGENRDKLSLNFMYDPPAGMKKEQDKEGEVECKFEWQRKYKAPRESYLTKDDDVQDQPFGIQVRNVHCIKCGKWGHINTDKECELFTAPWEVANATTSTDPLDLMKGMRDGGIALKSGVVEGTEVIPADQLVSSDESDSESEEVAFLKSLSKSEKLKLLAKLEKMEKKKKNRSHKKSKKHKSGKECKNKKEARKRRSSSEVSNHKSRKHASSKQHSSSHKRKH